MKYIAEQYQNYEYPLVPSKPDLFVYQHLINQYLEKVKDRKINVLICGVTPELVKLDYSDNAFVLGVDYTEEMVKYIWPGDIPGKRQALKANWLDMEIEPSSIDIILGDGALNFLDESAYETFLRKVVRILKPNGLMIHRVYLANNLKSPEDCYQRIFDKYYNHLTEFRLSFMRSVQHIESQGVIMSDVYKKWYDLKPNLEEIANKTGYDVSILKGMDLYKDQTARLFFHPLNYHEKLMNKFFNGFESISPAINMGTEVPIIAAKEPKLLNEI